MYDPHAVSHRRGTENAEKPQVGVEGSNQPMTFGFLCDLRVSVVNTYDGRHPPCLGLTLGVLRALRGAMSDSEHEYDKG